MKDLIIVAAILVAVFVGGYYSEKYIESSGKDIVQKLEELETVVISNENKNFELTEELERNWEDIKSYWNVLTLHQTVDDIELSIKRAIKYYQNDEKEECLVNLNEARQLIIDVPKSMRFEIVNIF